MGIQIITSLSKKGDNMPKFEVKLKVTRMMDKPVWIYAPDEAEAEEKAVELVCSWDGVEDAEVFSVDEA
jgi:hypothetical protein